MRPLARRLVERAGVTRAYQLASLGSLVVLLALAGAAGWAALSTELAVESGRNHNAHVRHVFEARRAIGQVYVTIDGWGAQPVDAARRDLRQTADAIRPALMRYDSTLAGHQAASLGESGNQLADLETRQETTLVVIPVAVALATLLLVLLWSVALESRHAELRREAELALWAHEAMTDELTGARNRRAFREDLETALGGTARAAAPLTLALLDVIGLKAVNDTEGHHAGDDVLHTLTTEAERLLRDGDRFYRLGGDEFAILLQGTGAWGAMTVIQRLHLALVANPGRRVRFRAGLAEAGPDHAPDTLIGHADEALLAAKRCGQGAQIYTPAVRTANVQERGRRTAHHARTLATALARAVDAKDSYTRSHSETVSALCGLIGSELGFEPERLDRLKIAGLLHDVGKIGVSDAILQKPGRLTAEEFEAMKAHSLIGHDIVASAEFEEEAMWVRHHHERIDGRGYPDGLDDGEIPLESRVIHVADAFEAMTSDRPYRRGMPAEDALRELDEHSGTQFDRGCVEAFLRVWQEELTTEEDRRVGLTLR